MTPFSKRWSLHQTRYGSHVYFTYDADGRRTAIDYSGDGSGYTETFRYAGDVISAEYRDNVLVREYLTDESGAIAKLVIPAGQDNPGTYVVVWNGHGDATGLWRIKSDGSLELANSFSYGTWGEPGVTAGSNSDNGGASYGDLGFRFLYVGRYGVAWDGRYGPPLYHMGARHYHATYGRFLQPDPSALEANLYAYAENNPVTKIDPSGKFWIALVGIVVAVVRVAVVVVKAVRTVVRVAPRLASATAGAWLRFRGYRWNSHLFGHGISMFQTARAIMFGQRFTYLHKGICKVGYFLASTGVFVATVGNWIFTSFKPGNPANYIRNLKANPC